MKPGVLFVGNFLSGAGLNRGYSEELTERLDRRGWKITRTSTQRGRARRLADMVSTAWTHRRAYDIAHVDVFSGPGFSWAEIVCFELRRLGKPYALTLRGGSLPVFASRWKRRVQRLLESAKLVTAPSPYLADSMRQYRPDLAVLKNAIDTAHYQFHVRSAPAPRLVWVRAFHAIYNPALAVDVLAAVRTRQPTATLRMVGPDEDGSRAAVEDRARQLGIADAIELVGRVPKSEVSKHLASADVLINTTNVDNTPISVLEAMSSGLCIVSTDVGGIRFLLEHDRTALLVPPRDAAAMSTAVLHVLDDHALAARLSQQAHDVAAQHDWGLILSEWETTLARLASHA